MSSRLEVGEYLVGWKSSTSS